MNAKARFVAYLICLAAIQCACSGNSQMTEDVTLFPVKQAGSQYEYIDKDGKIVINPQFSVATIFRDHLALVVPTGSTEAGFISEDGLYAFERRFKQATTFSEGLAWTVASGEAPSAINTKGEVVFTLKEAQLVGIYSEGLAPFAIFEKGRLNWGFVDQSGSVKIPPQFEDAGWFHDGMAMVIQGGKTGYINNSGELVIVYQFRSSGDFKDGFTWARIDENCGIIDKKGEFTVSPDYQRVEPDGSRYMFSENNKRGWMDKNGKILINAQFYGTYPFLGKDLTPARSDKLFGYIDVEGKYKINPQFEAAYPFTGDVGLVLSDGKYGFVDSEGKYLVNPQFEEVAPDLLKYLKEGASTFDRVATEYVDLSAISKRIQKDLSHDKVGGLSLDAPLSTILSVYGKSMNDVQNRNGISVELIQNEPISFSSTLSLTAYLDPITSTPINGAWQLDHFDNTTKASQYNFSIKLVNRGVDQRTKLIDEIERSLVGFEKDETSSTPQNVMLESDAFSVGLYLAENGVDIFVYSIDNLNPDGD